MNFEEYKKSLGSKIDKEHEKFFKSEKHQIALNIKDIGLYIDFYEKYGKYPSQHSKDKEEIEAGIIKL